MNRIINNMKEKININICIKILFVFLCVLSVIPSISYYLEKGTIFKFDTYYEFLFNDMDIKVQTIYYFAILTLITLTYYFIIKNRKEIFKDFKSIMIFIIIVSLVFVVMIPFFSSDVFYYLGIGRLDGQYGQNPYYTTIKSFVDNSNINLQNDTVLMQGYYNDWGNYTVVYGPVWTLICRIVASASFGNIDIRFNFI